MSSLRDLLEAKERRRLVVPIQVSDATADHEAWMGIYVAMQAANNRDDTDAFESLHKQLGEAEQNLRSHWASVELQAMSSSDWERASQAWATEDVSGVGIDWPKALAPLLAECCVDPLLQDVAWWQAQLTKDNWSEGDRDQLKMALLRLNVTALEPHVPKD